MERHDASAQASRRQEWPCCLEVRSTNDIELLLTLGRLTWAPYILARDDSYRLSMHANPHPECLRARLMGGGVLGAAQLDKRLVTTPYFVLRIIMPARNQALIRQPDYRS